MAKVISPEVESDDMVNVELHRAESMSKSEPDSAELLTEKNQTVSAEKGEVFAYISSTAGSVFSEMKNLKIEVVMFLYMFSYVLRAVCSTPMVMDKVCLVHLGETPDICQNLAVHPDIKSRVEKLANNYALGHSMIQMIPSSILSCFIGSWSDTYGRKPPIIGALLGIILDGLGSAMCAGFMYSRVEFYLIPAIFTGFSGGFISVLTVLYSYASDVTTFKQRTMKYTIMEGTLGLALPLGQFGGGWLFKLYGYFAVFMISTVGHVLCLAFVLFVLKETKGLDVQDNWIKKFRNLWSPQPVIDSFKATIQSRPNKGREQILFLIIAMSIVVLTYSSTSGINYLYVHHMYDWNNTYFSTVSAVFAVIGTIAMFAAVPILRRTCLDDPGLGMVGSVSMLIKYITLGLATRTGVYFLANLMGILGGLGSLAGRSRISKVCSKNDIGKVFAFLTTAEAILPLIAQAVVSQVFNATLDIYPGTIYLILGCSLLVSVAIYIWLALLPAADYEEMYNNPQDTAQTAIKDTPSSSPNEQQNPS